jgi:putative ABC transport system substrate-binding protein
MSTWLAANLRDLGYLEGRNLIVDASLGEDKADRLPALALELARRKPDVTVAIGTSPIHATMRATTTVPVVFLTNADPVAAGIVPSLAQPGGNLSGIEKAAAALGVELIAVISTR